VQIDLFRNRGSITAAALVQAILKPPARIDNNGTVTTRSNIADSEAAIE
jgi:hypothetical protein